MPEVSTKQRAQVFCAVASLLLLLAAMVMPTLSLAQGGIAMGGPFYSQVFEIPQGAEISAVSVYVTVFNESDQESLFRMSYDAPLGVTLRFSEDEFSLDPGGQRQVFIAIVVDEATVPGEYELVARVQEVVPQVEGQIAMVAAASQKADLIIVGESSRVNVQAKSPDAEPIVSHLRLFQVVAGKEREVASSETGSLSAKVTPGSYVVIAYLDGRPLTEERFDVSVDETRQVDLMVRTVYIGGFGVVPNHFADSGELAHAEIVYSITNLYQNMTDVEVVLQVELNGTPIENISLITLGSLTTGNTGGRYNYAPSGGWQSGEYGFTVELYASERLYATAPQETLGVEIPASVDYVQIGVIVLIVAVIVIVIYIAVKNRKKN